MKFTLKYYQDDAVHDVLGNLRKAAKRWHDEGDRHAFSLTAATGAGKTVMAAAVFEALFYGDDKFEFEADPGAVVIWFSDDPALNEQTRFRLMEASDRLKHSDLVVVQNTYSREQFEARKIYFLNTQKLGKKSRLVRGFDPEEDRLRNGEALIEMRPDMRSHTIWDTIRNTIEDPSMTLYLVLDEAHRGMGNSSKSAHDEKLTIVKRLINGVGPVPALPVVWGISATVEKFNQAMAGAEGRSTLPNVVVDSAEVQESGLLKDTIVLDIPDEVGQFDTVLVRRGIDKLMESTEAWALYARRQDSSNVVKPLMVLQVPNTPDRNAIGRALDTIFQQWPGLQTDAIAHVFGEHSTQNFGPYQVPYISPERVQDATWVRVLIAKDAISTGWDCPRAEVMVSFRPARDLTHITQLLGRMVRSPLARRIPGNDRLNAVDCLLPFFDARSVESVASALIHGGDSPEQGLPGRRVLLNAREMKPNASLPEEIWEAFLALPSQSLPRRKVRSAKRLTVLAHELAADLLIRDAGKKAHNEMHKILDAAQVRFTAEIFAARKSVFTVEGKSLTADLKRGQMSIDDFLEVADYLAIEDAYRRAARVLSPDVARTYAEYLAERKIGTDSEEEALIEAHADIAALGLVPDVKIYLDAEADRLCKEWFTTYRVGIKALSDERQEAYRQIKEMGFEPQDVDLVKPLSWMEPTTVRGVDAVEKSIPTWRHHLLSDEYGDFPAVLNDWEGEVLDTEMGRPDAVAWYRNPSRSSRESLAIAYTTSSGAARTMCPDFVFFSEAANGIQASIVDPHGFHLEDALAKLRGLAQYADAHSDNFQRIEAVAKIDGMLRVLDLTEPAVRNAVALAGDARSLYTGECASDYM